MKKKICIIDYGVGNIASISRAIEITGNKYILSNNPNDIENCTHLILPGVGAFKNAMNKLHELELIKTIKNHHNNQKPLMGICLGMQLLFEKSFENGEWLGLGIFKGQVINLKKIISQVYKTPNIGWINIKENFECKQLDIDISKKYYHLHSFFCEPKNTNNCRYFIEVDKKKICVIYSENNTFGIQFHPEKSREQGIAIIKSFLNINS